MFLTFLVNGMKKKNVLKRQIKKSMPLVSIHRNI